jgi:hypothetical protein
VAVKVPVVAEAATVTLAGTVTLLLLLARATVAPPVEAALLNVTVQVAVPAPVNDAGLQVRPLTVTGAFIVTVELALAPLAVAVTVPEQSLAIAPAVAEKVAVVAPAATVTEAGAVRRALLDERVTASPPAGAAALVVTVQALTAPDVSDVGAQARAVTVTGGTRLNEAVFEVPFNVAVTTGV